MKKALFLLLAAGIIIRVFLSATAFHEDLKAFYYGGTLVSQGNLFNLYDYLSNLPSDNPILKIYTQELFIYPPLSYLYFALPSAVINLLIDPQVTQTFLLAPETLFGQPIIWFILLTFKFFYIFFDVTIAFFLASFFKEDKKKLMAFTFWIFNPVTLYATYTMGQFDIIPTFMVLLVLYLVNKSKGEATLYREAVLLGIGGAFKIFPLLLLVPLAALKKSWLERLKVLIIGVVTYGLTIIPFISSIGFRTNALLAGLSTKSFYSQLPVSGGQSIILFIVFVIFFYLIFLRSHMPYKGLWKMFFLMLLSFFIFTHSHPQWLVWITPFLVIQLVKSSLKDWLLVVLILISFAGGLMLFEPGLNIRLFAPLVPNLYIQPGFLEIFGKTSELNFYRSILHSLFVGVAAYYVYRIFPKKSEDS